MARSTDVVPADPEVLAGPWQVPGQRPPQRPPLPPSRRLRDGLARLRAKARAHLDDPLFRNAYALMMNTAATGLLGLLYWLLVARLYHPVDVGRASAAYSAMNLLAGVTGLSVTGALTRFLPLAGHHTSGLIARA